jgi:predicted house-cleaning noncanonical NTP pyrophosphatase (MazG superfamily)
MNNEKITQLLSPYPEEIKQLINTVLQHEQRFISFHLTTNSGKLKELKTKIREEIEQLSKTYEA